MKKLALLLLFAFSNALIAQDICVDAKKCNVIGTLRLYVTPPTSTAFIDLDDGQCIPIALEDSYIKANASLSGKKVSLAGSVLKHYSASGIVSYEENGRNISTLCNLTGIVIWANKVKVL
jgi:hypothetical protein